METGLPGSHFLRLQMIHRERQYIKEGGSLLHWHAVLTPDSHHW